MTNYVEPCPRCRAKGVRYFRIEGVLTKQPCKPCLGTGERTYKASPQQRARSAELAKARKVKKKVESIEAFKAEHPQIWSWMCTSAMEFAAAMRGALKRWGGLTPKQLEASMRCSMRKYG